MPRESDKHPPRVDDQLKHETSHLVDGPPTENHDQFRVQEGATEDERPLDPGHHPLLDEAPGMGLPEDAVERRSRLARHIEGSVFPANREALLASAERTNAPDEVVVDLRQLPPDLTFDTLEAVWEAIGGEPEGMHTA
jgi:hypothetical protein